MARGTLISAARLHHKKKYIAFHKPFTRLLLRVCSLSLCHPLMMILLSGYAFLIYRKSTIISSLNL